MRALLAVLALLAPGHASPHNYTVPAAHAQGTILVIHGGGWLGVGRSMMGAPQDAWLHRLGWNLRVIDYRPGRDSLPDTIAAFDALHTRQPVCAYGASAGGHLAQLLAVARPSLSCVISEAGIADLTTLKGLAAPFAQEVWGSLEPSLSPARYRSQVPTLAVGATADQVVNERRQLAELPHARRLLLRSAPGRNFTHTGITKRAMRRYHAAIKLLLDNAARSR